MPQFAKGVPFCALLLSVVVTAAGSVGCSSKPGPGETLGSGEVGGSDASGTDAFMEAGGGLQDAATTPDAASSPTVDGSVHVADAAPPTKPVYIATFLTLNTSQYLAAPATDGGPLTAAGAPGGPNEAFALTDLTGNALRFGDEVYLATPSGAFLSVAAGDGGALTFERKVPGTNETFILVQVDGGSGLAATGDEIALQTKETMNYVSAIDGGGGQVLANAPWTRSWETFTIAIDGNPSVDAGSLGGADAATTADAAGVTGREKVLAYLTSIRGKQSAIGVEDKDSTNPEADSDTMARLAGDAGQNASFWSADWGFGSGAAPSARENIVQEGIKQWGKGAIVQYIYHACPLSWGSDEQGCAYEGGTNPINGSYGDLTDAQWADLTTAGGTLNAVWLARLDSLASYFQELKNAGVAPLFRPLHEINGAWAWWQGRPGPTGSLLLYQITHDYLVNTKGLDNIIWVWNVQDYSTLASDVTVYSPGPNYFDIAALDVYDGGYTTANYNAMSGAAAGKLLGVAECEFLPDVATLASQPLWAYVVMWPDFFSDDTTLIPELFADSQILTLSAMPGWK